MSISVLLSIAARAATPKVHVIVFGKTITATWTANTTSKDDKPQPIKIRPLMVDGKIREYTLGLPHEITDRLFVVRRAFRINDSLPEETAIHWQWQRGGWLLVDRTTGKVSAINLPEFDALYSATSWYRDYAAYCGVSDDGKKVFAIVAQLNRRKPVLKKPLSNTALADDAAPDSACPLPTWQREPVRVSFDSAAGEKQIFAIRGHVVDVIDDTEEEEEAAK